MGKEENVKRQLKDFNLQLQKLEEHVQITTQENDTNLYSMNELVNAEVKDLRSANNVYAIELERN